LFLHWTWDLILEAELCDNGVADMQQRMRHDFKPCVKETWRELSTADD